MPDSSDMAERIPQRILIADKSGRLNEEAMRARISQEPEPKKETQASIPAQVDLSPATIDALAATLKQATGDPARGLAEAAVAAAGLLDEATEAKNSLTKPVEKRDENIEPESQVRSSSFKKEKENRMTWKEAEGILETYAEKKATGKKITSKEEEAADKALEERDRMVALAKKSGVLDKDMKSEAAAKMDYIVTDYPTNIASGRNLNPREMLTAAVESDLRSKGEPQGELEGIRRSWYDGVYRNVDQRLLEEQIAFRNSLGMPENPGLKRELSELQQRISVLNWGGLTQPTKERLTNLAGISADWLRRFGPDKDDYARAAAQAKKDGKDGLGLFHPHRLEDYDLVGETRGIFNEPEGKGLRVVIPDPIVTKLAQGGDFTSGKYDIFIELNRFAEGKGDEGLTKKLLEYALPGPENEMRRWGMLELAKFMNAIYNLASSADFKKFTGEKSLLNGIDPRPIANLINSVPEMYTAFVHYYEKFSDPKLIGANNDLVGEPVLRDEDRANAAAWGCSEGVVRAIRHFVTDFGVFPYTFSAGQKMANRYPALFDASSPYNYDRQKTPLGALLEPGIGFSLVDVKGDRLFLMKILKKKEYRKFLDIFSNTSNEGNTDPAWSIKMWGSFDAIHDLIDLSWKNSMKQLQFTAEVNPKMIAAQNQLNSFPELDYLVQTKLLTLKPVRLVAVSKMTASAEGTRTLKPNQAEIVTRYLFNLQQANPGQPDGELLNDGWNPLQLFTPPGRLIIEALRKSRIRAMKGLDGSVMS